MSPEAINKAIAGHLGVDAPWWNCKMHGEITPDRRTEAGRCLWCNRPLKLLGPNYHGDLNAMHEAEQSLSDDDCRGFHDQLMDNKPPRKEMASSAEKWTWHASAAQRSEAFLRTIGKWEGGPQ